MWSNEFKINECKKCVYVKNTEKNITVCLYVDEMFIIGSKDNMIKATNKVLTSKFDMKDIGIADIILRNKITRTF